MYNEDEYVGIETLCELLSICKSTAYKLLKAKGSGLPFYRIGSRYKIRLKDIYTFMDMQPNYNNKIVLK